MREKGYKKIIRYYFLYQNLGNETLTIILQKLGSLVQETTQTKPPAKIDYVPPLTCPDCPMTEKIPAKTRLCSLHQGQSRNASDGRALWRHLELVLQFPLDTQQTRRWRPSNQTRSRGREEVERWFPWAAAGWQIILQ